MARQKKPIEQRRVKINLTIHPDLRQWADEISLKRRRVDRYDLNRELMDGFWNCILDLGRIPEPGEFDQIAAVRKVAGSLAKAFGLAVFLRRTKKKS